MAIIREMIISGASVPFDPLRLDFSTALPKLQFGAGDLLTISDSGIFHRTGVDSFTQNTTSIATGLIAKAFPGISVSPGEDPDNPGFDLPPPTLGKPTIQPPPSPNKPPDKAPEAGDPPLKLPDGKPNPAFPKGRIYASYQGYCCNTVKNKGIRIYKKDIQQGARLYSYC